jgi:hypothetical protein
MRSRIQDAEAVTATGVSQELTGPDNPSFYEPAD